MPSSRLRRPAVRIPVYRRTHILQRVIDARQAFGVADEQISAGLQVLRQPVYQTLLRRLVEVNHDIAAEDQWKTAIVRKRLYQVQAGELNAPADLGLDPVPALRLAVSA